MSVNAKRQKRTPLKSFTREMLSNDSVILPGVIGLSVRVSHAVDDGLRSFLDFVSACDSWPPIEHHFTVVAEDVSGEESLTGDQQVALMGLTPPLGGHDYSPTPEKRPQDVVLAALHVTEYPANWLRQARMTWHEAVDGTETNSGEGWVLSMVMGIEKQTENFESTALIGGSLFVYRMLEVHPALRGQGLGPRLMAHALASLPRTGDDVSVCVAYPESTRWDPRDAGDGRPREPLTPGIVNQLVRIYERLGFSRWKRVPANSPAPMWLTHDVYLPFDVRGDE